MTRGHCRSSWLTARTSGGWFGSQTACLVARGLAGVLTNWLNETWPRKLLVLRVHECGSSDHRVGSQEISSEGLRVSEGPLLRLSALIKKKLSDLTACMQTHRRANPLSHNTIGSSSDCNEMVWFSCGGFSEVRRTSLLLQESNSTTKSFQTPAFISHPVEKIKVMVLGP